MFLTIAFRATYELHDKARPSCMGIILRCYFVCVKTTTTTTTRVEDGFVWGWEVITTWMKKNMYVVEKKGKKL